MFHVAVAHHVLVATTNPASLYNHQAAIEVPKLWALIHGGLFLAMCVISIVHWNFDEKTRDAERSLLDRLRLAGALREAEMSWAQVALIMG